MSRFRVVLSTGRTVEAPLNVKTWPGAKRHGAEWASDVGVAGWIQVEENSNGEWTPLFYGLVRNSSVVQWEAA